MSCNYAFQTINVYPHHIKKSICGTRAKYRDGRKDTAVKVYTINQESVYLIISNVPTVGASEQLQAICDQYGNVVDFRPLDEYPSEEFTEVYLVKYDALSPARIAKKQLDDKSFFGGILHCCYAPEFETVTETRSKLQERRKYVAWKTNSGACSHCMQLSKKSNSTLKQSSSHGRECEGSHTSFHSYSPSQEEPVTYVWAGKEYTVMPPTSSTREIETHSRPKSTGLFVPRQCKSSGDSYKAMSHYGQSSSSGMSTSTKQDSSYLNTISQVRSKIASVSVPNVRFSLKRKKRL
nr:RNA-binding protein 48 isoform X1 [Parasteatoda tepidariorum]